MVGGLLLKGAGLVAGKAAPTVVAVLSRGGKGAVRWFRNLLARAPQKDRELLQRLWLKAESQGLQSLSEVEKQELRALLGRMEKSLKVPLDEEVKREFRRLSRLDYFEIHNPQLARLLGPEELKLYQVHHIYPLEYAHLFPTLDINGKANLAGVHQKVHRSINLVWQALRKKSEQVKPQDIKRVVDIVDRYYRRWYDKAYNPSDAATLGTAQKAALREVADLMAVLSP